jgi:Uma2 family endonuclease
MSLAPKTSTATLGDLLAVPEHDRFHEVVGGELVRKAMPSARHGNAQGAIRARLDSFHRRPGGKAPGGWWFLTEVEVELDRGEIYRPDVAGWRRERLPALPDSTPITLRPDWVCEVLSRSNASTDTVTKLRVYHRVAVPHYWIVDPDEETLTVLRWTPDGFVTIVAAARGERVRAEPFEAVEIRIDSLFGDDPDE